MDVQNMTREQRGRIFGLIRELGWTDDERRDALRAWTGKDSLSATADRPLTVREAEQIIGRLNVETARQRSRRRRERKGARANWPANRATPEQISEIWRAGGELFGRTDAGKRTLLAWLAKYFKVTHPARLSVRRATDVISALHKMRRDGWKRPVHAEDTRQAHLIEVPQ